MDLLFKLNGTKARMMYKQDRETARYMLHETMRSGCILIDTWLEYRIVDALHERDTEPALLEDEVFLSVSGDPPRDPPFQLLPADNIHVPRIVFRFDSLIDVYAFRGMNDYQNDDIRELVAWLNGLEYIKGL